MFDWDPELLDGKTHESRAWREEIDEYWTKEPKPPSSDWYCSYLVQSVCVSL